MRSVITYIIIVDINSLHNPISEKEAVNNVNGILDINLIKDDSFNEESYKIEDEAAISNNQLKYDNKFVHYSPKINLDNKMEKESIFCENCKKLYKVQIDYDDHLGMCFYNSDIYMNNNEIIYDNSNKTLKQNNLDNLEDSPYKHSFQENIEEEKKREDDFKCLKCKTRFQTPFMLDMHNNSCKGKTWEEEKIKKKIVNLDENSFDFIQRHPFESIKEESIINDDRHDYMKRINFLHGLNSIENRVNYFNNNINLYSYFYVTIGMTIH
jgi:hypothetical protein